MMTRFGIFSPFILPTDDSRITRINQLSDIIEENEVKIGELLDRENNLYDQISRTKITTLRDGYDRAILKMKNDRERLESKNNDLSQKKALENQDDLTDRANNIGNFHTTLSSLTRRERPNSFTH